ncbi:flippase [Clostridium sp. YIM B02551]|uniref:flippase n=1 Tax=Clostridium sp. YIM B02551 TaxID=2910679 RepID=UPI001EEA3F38|nr:flippase [Clostridium sp. YIM B02551]
MITKIKNGIREKSILKNGIYITISRFTKYFLMLLFTILSTRYLSTEDYGRLSYYISQISIISIFFTLGTDIYIVIQISKHSDKKDKYITQNIINRIIMISTITTLFILNILVGSKEKYDIIVILLYLSFIFDSFRTVSDGYFQAIEEMKIVAFSELLRSILLLIFMGIFVLCDLKLTGLALAYFISTLIVFISCYYIMFIRYKVKLTKFSLTEQKVLIVSSIPFFINILVNVLTVQIDIIMIKNLMGYVETAYYNSAKKFIDIVLIIPGIITTVLLPKLSKKEINSDNNKKLLKGILLIGIVVMLGTLILSKFLITIAFGKQYLPSYKILNLFALGFPIIFINAYFGTLFNSIGKQKICLYVNIINTLLNVILNYFLIPIIKANGAAIATVITIYSTCIMYMLIFNKNKSIIFD